MLIVMDAAASAEDVRRVVETVESLGLAAHPIPGAQRTAIGITGNRGSVEAGALPNPPELVAEHADCLQVGARNMQNFSLLKKLGKTRKPILLKRGMSATLEELLLSAEYLLAEGNYEVILCERGVRTFSDHTRNTLDLSA